MATAPSTTQFPTFVPRSTIIAFCRDVLGLDADNVVDVTIDGNGVEATVLVDQDSSDGGVFDVFKDEGQVTQTLFAFYDEDVEIEE